VWWKLLLALVLIVLANGLAFLGLVAGSGASDNCGGCDATPAWAEPLAWVPLIALALSLIAAPVLAVRWAVRAGDDRVADSSA
jgi:hypothetical protein